MSEQETIERRHIEEDDCENTVDIKCVTTIGDDTMHDCIGSTSYKIGINLEDLFEQPDDYTIQSLARCILRDMTDLLECGPLEEDEEFQMTVVKRK